MLDGHFDYGNGYHGRVYLNPHQLFRHPSTIWRFAQDLIDLLPGEVVQQTEVVAGPVTGGAFARAHDCRAVRQPPQPDASPVQLRALHFDPAGGFTLRPFYRRELHGKRVLLVDDVRNTGETFARCAALVDAAGGTVVATIEIYDRCEAVVDLAVPNIALVEYRAPQNYKVGACPMCGAGTHITRF